MRGGGRDVGRGEPWDGSLGTGRGAGLYLCGLRPVEGAVSGPAELNQMAERFAFRREKHTV